MPPIAVQDLSVNRFNELFGSDPGRSSRLLTVGVVTGEIRDRYEAVYMPGALSDSVLLIAVLGLSGISRETGRNVRKRASPCPHRGASTEPQLFTMNILYWSRIRAF